MTHKVLVGILAEYEIQKLALEYRDNASYSPTIHQEYSVKSYVQNTLAYELDRAKNPVILHVNGQPYATTEDMRKDISAGLLRISVDYNNPSFVSPNTNLLFRAMHDLQHARTADCNFNFWGECCAYILAARLTHDTFIRQWLFSEIVGQVSYLRVFGAFPEQRNVLISDKIREKIERVYNG